MPEFSWLQGDLRPRSLKDEKERSQWQAATKSDAEESSSHTIGGEKKTHILARVAEGNISYEYDNYARRNRAMESYLSKKFILEGL